MPALHAPRARGIRDAPLPSSISLLADNDVGCVGMFHSDNVIAVIGVGCIARHDGSELAADVPRRVHRWGCLSWPVAVPGAWPRPIASCWAGATMASSGRRWR